MSFFKNRPVAAFGIPFYICACIFYRNRIIGTDAYLICAACAVVFVLCTLFALWLRKRVIFLSLRLAAIVLSAISLAAVSSSYNMGTRLNSYHALCEKEYSLCATVEDIISGNESAAYYTVKVNNGDLKGDRLIFKSTSPFYSYGDVFNTTVVLTPLDTENFNGESYYLPAGIVLNAEQTSYSEYICRDTSAVMRLKLFAKSLCGELQNGMGMKSGSFAAALFLGDKSFLADSITRDFRDLGISHLLAISGTHLATLVWFVDFLLSRTYARRRLRVFVLCPLIIFYMILTGLSFSICRAGIMLLFLSLSKFIYIRHDGITNLSLTLVFLCLQSPYTPLDIGLQFSSVSVAALISISALRLSKNKLSLVSAFAVPCISMPVFSVYFGAVPVFSPLANLILIPIIFVCVIVCAALTLVSPIKPLYYPFAEIVGRLIGVLLDFIAFSAENLYCNLSIDNPVVKFLLSGALVLFVLFLCSAQKVKRAFASMSVFFFVSAISWAIVYTLAQKKELNVAVYSTDFSDTVCISSGGVTALVDMSNGSFHDNRQALSLCSVWGCYNPDILILSGYYQAISASLSEFCENYRPKTVYLPKPQSNGDKYSNFALKKCAEQYGVDVCFYDDSTVIEVGDAEIYGPTRFYKKGSSISPSVSFGVRHKYGNFGYSGIASTETRTENAVFFGSYGPDSYILPPTNSNAELIMSSYAVEKFVCTEEDLFDRVTVTDKFTLSSAEQ